MDGAVNVSTGSAGARARTLQAGIYVLMVVVPVLLGVLLLLHARGASDPSSRPTVPAGGVDPVAKLLLALPVIFVVCHLTAAAFRRLGQPPVIGEIVAGILLGPSLLGWAWPAAYNWLFPPYLTPVINALAQLGLILFMFLVGYEVNTARFRRQSASALLVSHVSIALPFLSGILLALVAYRSLGEGTNRLSFALFFAVSMSITAFPVLARILTDRKMERGSVGSLTLICASIDDVTAWCLLAVVTAVSHGTSLAATGGTVAMSVAFFAFMVFLVRPYLARLLADGERRRVRSDAAVLAVLLAGLMLSALATNEIGIHPIFGAFLFGLVTPRGCIRLERVTGRMHGLTTTMLLPLFFVYTGLRTKFGLLGTDARLWLWCALVTVIAILGKWVGSTTAARASGLSWQDSWSVGALMNCRGLTELVVLNIGLSLKIISPTVFTILVIMTLVSTMMTSPSLSLIERIFSRRSGRDAPVPVSGSVA